MPLLFENKEGTCISKEQRIRNDRGEMPGKYVEVKCQPNIEKSVQVFSNSRLLDSDRGGMDFRIQPTNTPTNTTHNPEFNPRSHQVTNPRTSQRGHNSSIEP